MPEWSGFTGINEMYSLFLFQTPPFSLSTLMPFSATACFSGQGLLVGVVLVCFKRG